MSRRDRPYSRFPRYTSVAERKARAAAMADSLTKNNSDLQPVSIEGRLIARSFWGKAWCSHLEKFSDFSNRLPRGRSYVRGGSVIDLKIAKGLITASVAGSRVYQVSISVSTLPEERWEFIKEQCAGGIDSALELLQGKISNQVMQTVCDRDNGLFPHPIDIKLDCNCPDWATLCKHLAAVLYGVGARLDESPELLFLLRGVDPEEMIRAELAFDTKANTGTELKGDLSDIFGIDIDDSVSPPIPSSGTRSKKSPQGKKASRRKKKSAKKKKATGELLKRAITGKKAVHKARKIPALLLAKKRVPAKKKLTSAPASGISIDRGLRASHLKALRKRFQLSVAELARLSNVSSATISRWEKQSGVIHTREATLESITRVFEMSYAQMQRGLKKS